MEEWREAGVSGQGVVGGGGGGGAAGGRRWHSVGGGGGGTALTWLHSGTTCAMTGVEIGAALNCALLIIYVHTPA